MDRNVLRRGAMTISRMMVVFAVLSGGCAMQEPSAECLADWEAGADEGEACEAAVAAIVADYDDPPTEAEQAEDAEAEPQVVAPRDVNTGLANGRRTYKPVFFTVSLD
jgi:hypothetical protein